MDKDDLNKFQSLIFRAGWGTSSQSLVESAICFEAISLGRSSWANDSKQTNKKKTEQTDEEGWLCAGDCSGVPGADYAKRNAAQVDEYNEQH